MESLHKRLTRPASATLAPSNYESGDAWWAWLTHDMAGARDDRAENLSTHPSPARTHQLRAARAFVAGDLTAAIDAFSKALELSADADATIRADLLRLRSAALLRRREHERALDDAHHALEMLGEQSAALGFDPSREDGALPRVSNKVLQLWHMQGVALAGLGRFSDAIGALSRVLGLTPARGPHFEQLLDEFLSAASAARNPVRLPLRVYRTSVDAEYALPAYRVVARPLFVPWPLSLPLAADDSDGVLRAGAVSAFCAHAQAPTEAHTATVLVSAGDTGAPRDVVVLDIRHNGTVEALSNSSAAAWRLLSHMGLKDAAPRAWETLSDGWVKRCRAADALGGVVQHELRTYEAGRSRQEIAAQEAAYRRQCETRELTELLVEFGIEELLPALTDHNIDMEALAAMGDEDLIRMGVAQLGTRRKLVVAAQSRIQRKQFQREMDVFERERADLERRQALLDSQVQQEERLRQQRIAENERLAELLDKERQRVRSLEHALQEAERQLQDERSRNSTWRGFANEFADDTDNLQKSLKKMVSSQRSNVREMREKSEHFVSSLAHAAVPVGANIDGSKFDGVHGRTFLTGRAS